MRIERRSSKIAFVLAGLLAVVLFTFGVSAFGVAFDNNKMKLYPGEVLDTPFILQNVGDDVSDVTIEATIEEGSDYLTFVDGVTRFDVSAQDSLRVPTRLSVPAGANVGDSYEVRVLFRIVNGDSESEGEGTSVGMLFSQRKTIEIEVVSESEREPVSGEVPEPVKEETVEATGGNTLVWVVVVVVVVVILWFLFVSRGNSGSGGTKKKVRRKK